MCLYPYSQWKALGYDICDSADPDYELEGWAYSDIPPPDEGEEGWVSGG